MWLIVKPVNESYILTLTKTLFFIRVFNYRVGNYILLGKSSVQFAKLLPFESISFYRKCFLFKCHFPFICRQEIEDSGQLQLGWNIQLGVQASAILEKVYLLFTCLVEISDLHHSNSLKKAIVAIVVLEHSL